LEEENLDHFSEEFDSSEDDSAEPDQLSPTEEPENSTENHKVAYIFQGPNLTLKWSFVIFFTDELFWTLKAWEEQGKAWRSYNGDDPGESSQGCRNSVWIV